MISTNWVVKFGGADMWVILSRELLNTKGQIYPSPAADYQLTLPLDSYA